MTTAPEYSNKKSVEVELGIERSPLGRVVGYYYLISEEELPTLVRFYKNPDTDQYGFGFNIADGGGFLPEYDLKESTKAEWAYISITN